MDATRITISTPEDHKALLALYPEAFPDEDLTGLVADLLGHPDVLSLTAWTGLSIAGHAVLTRCSVTDDDTRVALLGPLCVAPQAQRQGLGRALIEDAARQLKAESVSAMLVLGDPNYYTLCGFDQVSPVAAPYPLKPEWRDAWRMRPLTDAAPERGTLRVPTPWADPVLWS
ncbi:GNAT family N-acetyltransferase [Oceanicaulis alexandrii]|uniref:GNAT family N-acetyltransferase n=1 Tax=Oceanicaulis alexandrii TaxID=153233 RepID=UPI0035CF612F